MDTGIQIIIIIIIINTTFVIIDLYNIQSLLTNTNYYHRLKINTNRPNNVCNTEITIQKYQHNKRVSQTGLSSGTDVTSGCE